MKPTLVVPFCRLDRHNFEMMERFLGLRYIQRLNWTYLLDLIAGVLTQAPSAKHQFAHPHLPSDNAESSMIAANAIKDRNSWRTKNEQARFNRYRRTERLFPWR